MIAGHAYLVSDYEVFLLVSVGLNLRQFFFGFMVWMTGRFRILAGFWVHGCDSKFLHFGLEFGV